VPPEAAPFRPPTGPSRPSSNVPPRFRGGRGGGGGGGSARGRIAGSGGVPVGRRDFSGRSGPIGGRSGGGHGKGKGGIGYKSLDDVGGGYADYDNPGRRRDSNGNKNGNSGLYY